MMTVLQVDQFSARQIKRKLGITEGVFEVATRDPCVLAGEHLGAHAFAMSDGIDDSAMLVGRNQKQLVQVSRDILPLEECRGRGKRKGAGLLDGAAQHPAV